MRISCSYAIIASLLALSQVCRASTAEYADCDRLPVEVMFRHEAQAGHQAYVVRRYERYSNEDWIERDYKNPERSMLNGPSHGRNCSSDQFDETPHGAIQQLSFKFKTVNYFSVGIADHLAIVLRASFDRTEGVVGGSQNGRGLAMFPTATYAENFSYGLGSGTTFTLRDGNWYTVDIIAGRFSIAFLLTDRDRQITSVSWKDAVSADATGYGFAVLCAQSKNASCEFAETSLFARQPFEIYFSDIALRWSVKPDKSEPVRFEKRRPQTRKGGFGVR